MKKKTTKKTTEKKERATAPLRSKSFAFELYPEWPFFESIIAYIQKFKYAFIVHDKDTKEDGEIKKSHVHLVIMYGGRRTLTSVQNEFKRLGLEPRFVQTCNERAMLRYLTHRDDLDKYQYPRDEIETNAPDRVEIAYADEITSEIAFNMLNEFIDSQEGHITQSQFNKYAFNNGLMVGLRRYSSSLNNALREHNRALDQDFDRMNKADFQEFLMWKNKQNENKIKALEHRLEREGQQNESKPKIFDEDE